MAKTNVRNVAIATATLACMSVLSFGWSAQRGISLSIESAQAQVVRPYWRTGYGYGAGLAAGPWEYYGGSPCDYERTGGGYYRGAGWDRSGFWGSGAHCGDVP
jgi:hypothetical protein